MEFLQNLDGGTVILLALGCGLLCVVGVALSLGFQLVGGFLDLVGGVFAIFGGLTGGGEISCCGCIVLLGGLSVCGVGAFAIYQLTQTCGTPDAINLCRLFGL